MRVHAVSRGRSHLESENLVIAIMRADVSTIVQPSLSLN